MIEGLSKEGKLYEGLSLDRESCMRFSGFRFGEGVCESLVDEGK